MAYATIEDRAAVEAEMPWSERGMPPTIHEQLRRTAEKFGSRKATTFQMFADAGAPEDTLTWIELLARTNQTANLFRSLGVGEGDKVAFLLPNTTETILTYIGGTTAGIVCPINPLLKSEHIGAILRDTGAKVLVTLRAFPKTDIAQKTAEALELAPNVETVLEIDLLRYITGIKKFIIPLIRPKVQANHKAKVLDFNREIDKQPTDLTFKTSTEDRVGACFHTGGTTGMPKVVQHRHEGILYNGWIGARLLFRETDVIMCPLPIFHVFATTVTLGASLCSGAQIVFPTPAGYRGDGVFDNFWKLIERYRVTFIITVPTAMSALMQRPVDADISSLKLAFSGSSPLPVELYKRFEAAAGVTICEGYGLTEATCLVSINPPDGEKRVGSIGFPFPYTDVKIIALGDDPKECATDEIGEICVSSPGVVPGETYTDPKRNEGLYYNGTHLRTGDLGRFDEAGYLWITGRAKDLIIRGGHNIDPAEIEDALSAHDAVAVCAAIGQPDAYAGELPCAYVELVGNKTVDTDELIKFANERIHERAAYIKHLEVIDEIPKTAVGKPLKNELRKLAIKRIYDAALKDAGLDATVEEVVEDKRRGLVAKLTRNGASEGQVSEALGNYTRPWEWAD
ncbi:acyl-CoA synthetase [Pelagovum pacificum]|uniref:Acyl-CoA synthetase n=1 Tax=Pelagovum pacificum TaxID=2588711 RepID=A0A5C5GDU8_9RHOB|nr:acyl-CoA synthetase [Pelagovum pacificum]QQA43917.1 acyl-CoA synthetase [Pelagovum pacificum]TNY32952.1 acyl-CoA synthetase [Pelagovum pacificum]